MNYKQQLSVVTGLFVPPDTTIRMDCPFCSGKNTLSVDTTENNLRWYCFHATCNAKGTQQGEKNMQYVEKVLKGNKELFVENDEFKPFVLMPLSSKKLFKSKNIFFLALA